MTQFGDRRVVVTRPLPQAEELRDELLRVGLEPLVLPLLEFAPPKEPAPLEKARRSFDQYDLVVFTSVPAVTFFFASSYPSALSPAGPRIAAVGESTAQALKSHGFAEVVVPEKQHSESLLAHLSATLPRNSKILLPQAPDARSILCEGLRSQGHTVFVVHAYDKRLPIDAPSEFQKHLATGPLGWVTFTSPRVVRHFVSLVGDSWAERRGSLRAVSIGPTTTRALRQNSVRGSVEASTPNNRAIADAIASRIDSLLSPH